MKSKIKNSKGITLVTLVITIVIIIILATISINFMFGDNGLITRAEEAKEMHAISSIKERMEIAKGTAFIDGEGYIDPDRYFEILEEENIIIDKDTDVVEIEDGVYEVTTEPGYIFEVTLVPSKDDVDDIEIDYIGKGDKLGPKIKEIKIQESTTNSINIEVDARRADGAEYTYWIKKESEGEESWIETEGNANTCSFTNLEANVVYNIKVKVVTKNGEDEEETSTITGELPVGTITFTDTEWIGDGTAKIRINTSAEGYTLQYQVNGIEEGNWKDITSGAEITGLTHGQTVYGRLFDGTNGTKDDASASIVDEIAPTVTVTEGAITTNSITVNVNANDGQSGMQASPTYTYYIKESSAGDASYTAKEIGTTANSYTFTGLKQETSYDVKVEVNGDKALNIGEGKLLNQTTGKIGGAEGGLVTGNIVASSPVWSGGTASITLSTNTGLTIQYQVGGIAEGSWKTGTSVTGLNHNDTVYARLTDGTNYGDHASVTITDKVAPNAPTINLSGTVGTNGWYKSNVTATITAGADGQSGANKVRYVVSGAQTVGQTDTNAGTTSASITITGNGASTITAYTIDKAGNVSAAKTQVVNKDNVAPTASITLGTITQNSIAVSVSANDTPSGIATYNYYLNGAHKGTAGNSFNFTGLTAGTSYTLRVDVADKAGNTVTQTITAVPYATVTSKLKAGDYVTYPSVQGDLACRVLYDNSSGYGVQLITSNCPKDVTLGSSNFTTSMNSYNNVISILNNEAMGYNNSTYSSDARCVGSVPNNKNSQAGMHITQFGGTYSGKLRDTDTNYETDYNKMQALGIRGSNRYYWLASRYVSSYSYYSAFYVCAVDTSGNLSYSILCLVYSDGYTSASSDTYGLRPVFTLNSGIKITGGNGTSSSPYTLGV